MPNPVAYAIGIDLGTSGVRAVAVDREGIAQATCQTRMDERGPDPALATTWWSALEATLDDLGRAVDLSACAALAVDGTSGTLLAIDADGQPLARALMYNDAVEDRAILEAIAGAAPATSAAHGATSGAAKLMVLQRIPRVAHVLHQADWIAGRLAGRFDTTDENNALKTGYDPVARRWPDWLAAIGARVDLLPKVIEPGRPIGPVDPAIATRFGLPLTALIVAGTTDGCASFLATGVDQPGDAVTALGSTLTLKILSDQPIFSPLYGIYSHRIRNRWLAGGASNTGGKVLASLFDPATLTALSARIDPDVPTGLDYYPLPRPGERFPINDPELAPRMTPRPPDDARYLQALFEGMAAIEALGYRRLAELGAPPLHSVYSVGGGASNATWRAIRARAIGCPMREPLAEDACRGTVRLALSALGSPHGLTD